MLAERTLHAPKKEFGHQIKFNLLSYQIFGIISSVISRVWLRKRAAKKQKQPIILVIDADKSTAC